MTGRLDVSLWTLDAHVVYFHSSIILLSNGRNRYVHRSEFLSNDQMKKRTMGRKVYDIGHCCGLCPFLIFSVFGMILSSKRKNPAIVREFFENSSWRRRAFL